MGKVIHWELYKKLKLQNKKKWYIQKSEDTIENKTSMTLR